MFKESERVRNSGGLRYAFDGIKFAKECERIAERYRNMKIENGLQMIFSDKDTSQEEREFLKSFVQTKEVPDDTPRIDYVTFIDVHNFRSPKTQMTVQFTPDRIPMAKLFEKHFDGTHSVGGVHKKHKKIDVAEFGKLIQSEETKITDVSSFRKAMSVSDPRKAKAEYMFFLCLYFKLKPYEAYMYFHQCEETDAMSEYPFIGGALYLFLEDETYDYEYFVEVCCKTLISKGITEVPEIFDENDYWIDKLDEYYASKSTWLSPAVLRRLT